MMYGGEPTPKSAPAPPPARPAGIAQERDSRPSGCRPKIFWKPTNMVNAPSATSTGLVGSVRSANAPMHAPIIPAGRSTLISLQFAFLLLVLPKITEAVKSSASTSGIAKCSGCDNARSGTDINPEPNPVMPRMKYALIRMHSTRIMSAIFAAFLFWNECRPGRYCWVQPNGCRFLYLLLQSRHLCLCMLSQISHRSAMSSVLDCAVVNLGTI